MPSLVYEFYNCTLRELYIGITPLSLQERWSRFKQSPPSSVLGWRFTGQEDISIHEVELFSNDSEAADFFDCYTGQMSKPGWKVIHGERPKPGKAGS